MRGLGIVALLAPRGVSIRENSFYRAPGGKWAQETCAGCPQQRYATGEPGKVQGWDRVGQYSRKIRFIHKAGVQD